MATEERKVERATLIYEDICKKLKELNYIIHVDESEVPVIATTREGFCFYIKVESCPYDWTKKEIADTLKTQKKG